MLLLSLYLNAVAIFPIEAIETWTLTAQSGLNNHNWQMTLSSQTNGTGGTIYAFNGSSDQDFIKRVTGSATDAPPWASWLKPLSYQNDAVTYAWPSYSPYAIPSGKVLRLWIQL